MTLRETDRRRMTPEQLEELLALAKEALTVHPKTIVNPNPPERILAEGVLSLAAQAERMKEALEDMCGQFAYTCEHNGAPALYTGGLSALEGAFEALGWEEPYPIPHDKCDEPGCPKRATCVSPTPSGYRRTCDDHSRAALEPKP